MKVVLVALNAQYIHTNLAVRSIAAYCAQYGTTTPQFAEYTINQTPAYLLRELYSHKADVYQFSCYIWNIGLVCQLAQELAKLLPDAVLVAGGPQVTYQSACFLEQNPAFDFVISGEGEQTSLQLYSALQAAFTASGKAIVSDKFPPLPPIPGVWAQSTTACPPEVHSLSLNTLPFPYPNIQEFGGRIVYYESMRGCPYKCSYCLSSVERGVRYKSLHKVFAELALLLGAKPKQVKFVDRTFNVDTSRAMAIWEYLQKHDNGTTNFHFEIQGELLTDTQIAFLAQIRPGLFQFEIGVQSTNTATLRAIQRPANLHQLFENVDKLRGAGNIHLHLDLIAGLPYEGFGSFTRSFNTVYSHRPHQFQLGFLKVLSGSQMQQKAAEYGLVYTEAAPFEILQNQWLSYEEISSLAQVASMVELYYNSGRFSHMVAFMVQFFATPFAFYSQLANYYSAQGYEHRPLGKTGQYELLGEFAQKLAFEQSPGAETCSAGGQDAKLQIGSTIAGMQPLEQLAWLCRMDMALHEKIHRAPAWVAVDGSRPVRERALAFYRTAGNVAHYLPNLAHLEAKQILKTAHIEMFPFNPFTFEVTKTAFLFDYTRRGLTGQAMVQQIVLPEIGNKEG